MAAVNRGSKTLVREVLALFKVQDMYPLLYEASMVLRTTRKDAELSRYVRNEFPGGTLPWFYASVPDAALRLRPRVRRRIRRWIDARRGRPVAPAVERAEPA